LHGSVWATPATLDFYNARWPDPNASLAIRSRNAVGFGECFEWRGARCTVIPAGHILGAAQLLIEYGGERLVYTGDIKLRAPLCGETTEVVPCDRLIIECTFGLPIYHFLERDEAARRIAAFARQCLDDGATPVFYGYALGRGQEIAHVLCRAGIPVAVHGAVARFIPYYERAGYAFDGWVPYDARRVRGQALVVTPGMRNILEASGNNFRVAYVSGWAGLANARARVGAEELIPYSDHGDFSELVTMIEQSGARRVDLVHGYTAAFARILRQRGIEAHAATITASEAEDDAGDE
jgi:Cft2 family RNA processing exonuclease